MKIVMGAAAVLALTLAVSAAEGERVVGDYVEARTAEVFAGGCIMNSEAETAGRQAVMAWRVASGQWNGVPLDGLAVAAAVAADRNLGMGEMGGEGPRTVRAIVMVDDQAPPAQRLALVALARELAGGLLDDVVRVEAAPVRFVVTNGRVELSAADSLALTVNKTMTHDPSCGAMQWFKPLSHHLTASTLGTAETHAFSGTGLGSKWSAPGKRSAFWGSFAY